MVPKRGGAMKNCYEIKREIDVQSKKLKSDY